MVYAVCRLFPYLPLPDVTKRQQYMHARSHVHKGVKFTYQQLTYEQDSHVGL